jgi:hypothetical protein
MAELVETDVASWLRSFPAEKVAQRLQELEEQRAELSQQISGLHNALETFRHLNESLSAGAGSEAEDVPIPEAVPSRSFPPKRVVALRLLGELPENEMSPREIRQALIERGEMGPGDNEYHALRVALQKAFKDGLVARPGTGRYRHLRRGLEATG